MGKRTVSGVVLPSEEHGIEPQVVYYIEQGRSPLVEFSLALLSLTVTAVVALAVLALAIALLGSVLAMIGGLVMVMGMLTVLLRGMFGGNQNGNQNIE